MMYLMVLYILLFIYDYPQRSALVGELEGTQARYGDQLARLQVTVTGLEDQLSQFHANIGNNKQDYETLLDVKSRLVREIAEYKRLLDGDARCCSWNSFLNFLYLLI